MQRIEITLINDLGVGLPLAWHCVSQGSIRRTILRVNVMLADVSGTQH
jgi:hypothetical protein